MMIHIQIHLYCLLDYGYIKQEFLTIILLQQLQLRVCEQGYRTAQSNVHTAHITQNRQIIKSAVLYVLEK